VAGGADDDTILMPRPAGEGWPGPRPARRPAVLALGAALLAAGLGGAWWLAGPGPAAPPPVAAPAIPAVPLMEREALLRWHPAETGLVRLAELPAVHVLVFPDLASQGRMMNRLAALIEKASTPRDRVLDDAALAAAIAADGSAPETYYYGHDYALGDVERFFALARTGGVVLNESERLLEAWLPRIRGDGPRAIISVPNEGGGVDASARRAILEHEAGHGLFFTDPDFAAQVVRAWRDVFTEAERSAFRRRLREEGYDDRLEWLMANEAMAHLVFTPDRRFFDPARDMGIDEAAAERLRAALRPAAAPR